MKALKYVGTRRAGDEFADMKNLKNSALPNSNLDVGRWTCEGCTRRMHVVHSCIYLYIYVYIQVLIIDVGRRACDVLLCRIYACMIMLCCIHDTH